MASSDLRIEWEAHEYEHKHRGSDWYWAVGIITVALSLTSIIFGNMLLGILILIGAFALSLFANRPPKISNIVVDGKGIRRDKVYYPYESLKSFWIDTEHPHTKIILRSQKMLMPLIIIPLNEDVDLEDLHDTLSHFITEEFHSLPFIEKLLEYLGF